MNISGSDVVQQIKCNPISLSKLNSQILSDSNGFGFAKKYVPLASESLNMHVLLHLAYHTTSLSFAETLLLKTIFSAFNDLNFN